jgi:DNA-binding NtrC family response regulator
MPGQILLVDDQPDMLLLLEMLITDKTPHRVVSTSNPFEVGEQLGRQDLNLVITELKMPQVDGIEVMEMVKRHDPDIPVIVITVSAPRRQPKKRSIKGPTILLPSPFARNGFWWP